MFNGGSGKKKERGGDVKARTSHMTHERSFWGFPDSVPPQSTMNWLAVIKAGRKIGDTLTPASLESETSKKVDPYEAKVGLEQNVDHFEAAVLAAILRNTTAQLNILSLGSASKTIANHSIRDNLLEVLEETELSLRTSRDFSRLFENAREVAARMQEAQWLENLGIENKETIAKLQEKLKGNQRAKQRDLHKKQEAIASLKDHIQELGLKRDVTLSYVDRSLDSQREQNILKNQMTEEELRTKLDLINIQIDQEHSVHEHLMTFLNFSIQDIRKQIEEWTEFYKTEVIRRSERLKIIHAKISEEKIKVANLTELYEEHQRDINEYLEFKEQKRLEAVQDQFMYDTATKIQAWWRGTMVRRGIGPYRKRKKPGKDKKKKK